jgi:membrane-associated phospholipid phosphatase
VLAARALTAALAVALAAPSAASADDLYPIRWDAGQDLVLTGVGAALWIGSELFKEDLARTECRFCQPNAFDAWGREQLHWQDGAPARRASDVLAFAVLPGAIAAHQLLAARGAGGDASDGLVDVLVVAEAAVLAADLNQLVKFVAGRQRPFVHYGNHAPGRAPDADDNLSFYSGHASLAFSLAAAAGTVSTLRGYDSAPWVWAGGMALATGVAYFRVAADKHYLTDVLTGAAVGTAIGIAVPRLLHPREERKPEPGAARVSVVPIPLGVYVRF